VVGDMTADSLCAAITAGLFGVGVLLLRWSR